MGAGMTKVLDLPHLSPETWHGHQYLKKIFHRDDHNLKMYRSKYKMLVGGEILNKDHPQLLFRYC